MGFKVALKLYFRLEENSKGDSVKVITIVNEYINTDKEIFIESLKGDCLKKVDKNQNLYLQLGERIADAKVKRTDETDTLVTILI